jgi:hypothetical protein
VIVEAVIAGAALAGALKAKPPSIPSMTTGATRKPKVPLTEHSVPVALRRGKLAGPRR